MEQATTCVVCGAPANTVIDGRDYCHDHDERHTPQVAIVACAVDGCGCPVAPSSRWCMHHQAHMERRAA